MFNFEDLQEDAPVADVVDNSVSVIGMACYFADASSPEQMWENLINKRDCIQEIPKTRWNSDELYSSEITPGKTATKWGSFVDNLDYFDNEFFGLSFAEASSMDPQQRMLLEVSYQAFHRAGYTKDRLNGTDTGVYVGICGCDYMLNEHKNNVYTATGTMHSIAANRISFLLGLQGPSIAMDTACSSSLVAVDLACRALKDEQCELAVAAGVNALIDPKLTIIFSQMGMMASDGRCKTFDAAANGYVRGEGCGAVVLKRTQDLGENEHSLAKILSTAINQDGQTATMTAPNGNSQVKVIQSALNQAGIPAQSINYCECHGTGTPLGDPIEIGALSATYGVNRTNINPLVLGSIKTNIGHLEGAAGIAGMIKAILVLQHKTVPGNVHFNTINPLIEEKIKNKHIQISNDTVKLNQTTLRATVSSFGFGGTNAHIILERSDDAIERPTHVFKKVNMVRRNIHPYLVKNKIKVDLNTSFLKNHIVQDVPVFPAAAFMEVMTHYGKSFKNLVFAKPFNMKNELDVIYTDSSINIEDYAFATILQHDTEESVKHVEWTFDKMQHDTETVYSNFSRKGLSYSEDFKSIKSFCCIDKEVWGVIEAPKIDGLTFHPALLDGVFQCATVLFQDNLNTFVPSQIEKWVIHKPCPEKVKCKISLLECTSEKIILNIEVYNLANEIIMTLLNFVAQRVGCFFPLTEGVYHLKRDNNSNNSTCKIIEASDFTYISRIKENIENDPTACFKIKGPGSTGFSKSLKHEYPNLNIDIPIEELQSVKQPLSSNVKLDLSTRGKISSLKKVPQWIPKSISDNMVEIDIRSVGLNFRDVLNVLGMYPGDPGQPGADAAGIVTRVGTNVNRFKKGDRVFGVFSSPLASRAVGFQSQICKTTLDFDKASSMPITGMTVDYCFSELRPLTKNDVVLVHSGAGGVGITAIRYCLQMGATVLATCSDKKVEYVKNLGVQVVATSRDAEKFKKQLNSFIGKVDVVLNSLNGHYIPYSIELLKENGTFLEIGKRGILSKEEMRTDIDYHIIAIDKNIEDHDPMIPKLLKRVSHSLDTWLEPLPTTCFDFETEYEKGFRFLQNAKQIGKVCLVRKPHEIKGSILITGGTGALGKLFTQFLLDTYRDVDVYVMSRTPNNNSDHERIIHIECDVLKVDKLKECVNKIPNLVGVIHAAGILEDALFKKLTLKSFEKVYNIKVQSAKIIADITSSKNLNFFITCSSIASAFGNNGQTNYALANSALDDLVVDMCKNGRVATSIQWGAWNLRGDGMADVNVLKSIEKQGLGFVDPNLGLTVLQCAVEKPHILPSCTIVSPIKWKTFQKNIPSWQKNTFKQFLTHEENTGSLKDDLKQLSPNKRMIKIKIYIREIIKDIVGKDIGDDESLMDNGLDSLSSVEFRYGLQKKFGLTLSSTLMFDYPSISHLTTFIISHFVTEDPFTRDEDYSFTYNKTSALDKCCDFTVYRKEIGFIKFLSFINVKQMDINKEICISHSDFFLSDKYKKERHLICFKSFVEKDELSSFNKNELKNNLMSGGYDLIDVNDSNGDIIFVSL